MEGPNSKNLSAQLRAFIACDIRVSIDDLHLTIRYVTPTVVLMRFYGVDRIPTDILAVLHMENP